MSVILEGLEELVFLIDDIFLFDNDQQEHETCLHAEKAHVRRQNHAQR